MSKKLEKTHLQVLMDKYETDLKSVAKVKPTEFSTIRVATMITSIPERKWNAAAAIVEGTEQKKKHDRTAKTLRATKRMEASRNKEKTGLSSAEERAAWVDNQPEVIEAEIQSINTEAELLAAKLAYECLDDLFTAGKKIMDWLTDQERQQRQFDKYTNEGNKNR